jgi:hypothetical protein
MTISLPNYDADKRTDESFHDLKSYEYDGASGHAWIMPWFMTLCITNICHVDVIVLPIQPRLAVLIKFTPFQHIFVLT